ncbi:hypothetical protein GBP07_00675 [Pediococcus acidilactici]|uniref:Uncharacterized protein n=1 Tax=Pediococcus acidilactici DSM 20284 TaxID=862514 RepID=E0NEZ7_PEDAC|nr:hypothetical protein CYD95_03975 [Pediococcus acidilactici]EFL96158.1 hypothetical protein HMPREF0623_0209 [Pediococcus acidilactici DSM 20284]KAF0368946.1 hypothetical protein GBO52_01745 [Pediococcus acidilactici]KAF0369593.1 hypothetical protein GBO55_02320 [Pediococcus acidilactici]KAF0373550.1 hypothetical protein GBO58_00980 [Pediococcus acidilactici]
MNLNCVGWNDIGSLKAYQVLIKLVKNGIEYFNQQQEMASFLMNTGMRPFNKLPNFILFCLST